MLQWMGGSRRKVTASRKSTHNRQKQYFEQRKRQQQATRSENHADGRNKSFNYHEGPRSLDVLSLNNLVAITQHFCVDKDGNDISQVKASKSVPEFPLNKGIAASSDHLKEMKDGVSKEKIMASESFLEFPSNKDIAGSSNHLKELKKSPCTDNGSLNLNISAATVQDCPVIPSGHDYSNIACDKLDEWKIPSFSDPCNNSKSGARADELQRISENQLSVLDLLSDDQSHSQSEGLPSGETHVAFSVKGLGKVRMETPVHSPGQVDSFHSPTMMASGWMCSSQNLPDDLGFKLGTMDDICFSAGDSSVELVNDTWEMKDYLLHSDSLIFSGKGGMPLYADAHQTRDDIFTKKGVSRNVGSKLEATREDKFGIFEEDLLDDRKYDASCDEKPFYMDLDVSKFSEIQTSATYDCGFEDTLFQNRRSAEEAWKIFGISDGPDTYFRHSTSMKDYDFVNLDSERYHGVDRSSHFKSKRPPWSFSMIDDATDNISLLSEESCSSTAVRNKQTRNLGTDLLKLKQNNRKRKKVKNSEKKSGMKTFANEVVHVDINDVLQEKNLVGTENNWTMPTQWTIKTKNCLKKSPAIEENLRAECIIFSREDHASVNTDMAPSFLYKPSTGTDIASVDCKFKSEDCNFNLFKVPRVHMDTDTSQRMSRPESEKRNQLPYITRLQKDCEDNEASDFQFNDCRRSLKKPQNEISVEKSRLPSGNARTAVVAELRDDCSEHEKSKHETSEPSEPSEVRNVSTLSKVSLAMENAPTSVQCVSRQLCRTDGPRPSSHQSYNRESRQENHKAANDNFESEGDCKADTSYQLMLESYVLQLLCVQKVLLESSKQEKP